MYLYKGNTYDITQLCHIWKSTVVPVGTDGFFHWIAENLDNGNIIKSK